MRDAIVLGYGWGAVSSAERVALALSQLGARVLYCGTPRSFLRGRESGLDELENNVLGFRPVIAGQRLNRAPLLRGLQTNWVLRQILRQARALRLRDPILFYPSVPDLLGVCRAMKRRGSFLVHLQLDHEAAANREHIELSDATFAVPRSEFHKLRARWGEKVHRIPQAVDLRPFESVESSDGQAPSGLAGIRRPRLGYAGVCGGRLHTRVLFELLRRHPGWSFVSFGARPALALPNAHVLPWQGREELARCVAAFDVGLMPYDCSDDVQLHCVPLKLFDYFALGLPVVATPLIHLWEYEELIYFGDTAEELEAAVAAALREPPDSPKREMRKRVAQAHSIQALASAMGGILERIGMRDVATGGPPEEPRALPMRETGRRP